MNPDMTTEPAVEPAIPLSVERIADRAIDEPLQSYLDFEVHVAAGQAWLAMPGHADCRAMYPNHARALATAIEQIAAGGGDRRVYLSQDLSLLIHREGTDLVLIREDTAARPDLRHAFETATDAARLARRIREAADLAERTMLFKRVA